MIKSLLESGELTISGSFDFEWWRRKGNRPARILIPVILHIFRRHHIVIFRNQGWNWNIAECLQDFCDIYPVDTKKLIVLSSDCIPEVWNVWYFAKNTNNRFIKHSCHSLSTGKAYELTAGKLTTSDYFAFQDNKKDDPITEVANKFTH